MTTRWMIYGANGYTGRLVAKLAVARGERPVLAGRNAEAVGRLATELGLPHVAIDLNDARALRSALDGIDAVAHCAGPFSATWASMVDACLAARAHYLDVTGEVVVFEGVAGRHAEAEAAGVVLLPGAGFDVVPTDCLANLLVAALPDAVALELAFIVGGGSSRGTAMTGVGVTAVGGLRRVGGKLVPTPFGTPRRAVPFPSGTRTLGAMTWGDLATAYQSTGIGDITVYGPVPVNGPVTRAVSAVVQRALRVGPVRSLTTQVIRRWVSGPDDATRATTDCEVWGEVRNAAGQVRSATLTGPNPYDLTADAVVRAIRYVMAGTGPAGPIAPGAHTPATAFGADFVRELDGVRVNASSA